MKSLSTCNAVLAPSLLLLLLAAVVVDRVGSFSVAPFGRSSRRPAAAMTLANKRKTTALFAAGGGFATAGYLDGLSSAMVETQPHRSATEAYLESLSQQSSLSSYSSMTTNPEEYLHSVSQLAATLRLDDAAAASSPQQAGAADLVVAAATAAVNPELVDAAATAAATAAAVDAAPIYGGSPSSPFDAAPGATIADISGSITTAEATAATTSGIVDAAKDIIVDSAAAAASSSDSPLASQLSGMASYDSLLGDGGGAAAAAATGAANSASGASASSGNNLPLMVERLSSSATTQFGKLFGQAGQAAKSALAQQVDHAAGTETNSKAVVPQVVGETSVSELAQSILGGLQTVGTTLVKILDRILDSVAGTSLAGVVASAQTSAKGVVDGVVQSAVHTLQDIGSRPVSELVEILVALVVAVAKVLFAILNAVVAVLSGREVSEWALAARATVEREAHQLTAQAGAAAADLSHKSLNELGTMVSGFSQDVGRLMVEGATSGALGGGTDGTVLAASSQFESVVSTAVSSVPF